MMIANIESSWIEINKKAFEHNVNSFKTIIRNAQLAAVIKSNAYGHGIELVAKICDQNKDVNLICVISLREAMTLRAIGIKKQILVLSIINGNLEDAVRGDIDLIAYDIETVYELNKIGKSLNKKADIHIKVDTGLSRLGLHNDKVLKLIKDVHELPFISIHGIFTHLAESESIDQTFTNYQIAKFNSLLQQLDAIGISIPMRHAACSAAATANLSSHFNVVRVGIGLYGLWPSVENKKMTQKAYPEFSLQPVLTWKTKIIQIKELQAGSFVGYDRTHQSHEPSRIAVMPVGYWDGFDRRLSNNGKVLINNQIAPIIGRIAMNLSMIDITGLDVSIDSEVTLLGNHHEITADDMAQRCGTINYEIVTRINPLLPRIII